MNEFLNIITKADPVFFFPSFIFALLRIISSTCCILVIRIYLFKHMAQFFWWNYDTIVHIQ
jgi:hypothetical protein